VTAQNANPPGALTDEAGARFSYFWPLPWRLEEEGYNGGPGVYDANGILICSLFWPCHSAADTKLAEITTYELGRTIAALQRPLAQSGAAPGAEAVAKAICCPRGCVRDDDCLAGQRREEQERIDAIMTLIRQSQPVQPSQGVTVTEALVQNIRDAVYNANGGTLNNDVRPAIRTALHCVQEG
jgi:hypothetical protein